MQILRKEDLSLRKEMDHIILSSASVWNGIPKEELIGRLRERG